MIRDRQDAPRQIVMRRPKMQKRLRAVPANFPPECGKSGDARAVFPQLHRTRGRKFPQIGFKLVA